MTGKHIRTTLIQAKLFPQLGFDEVAQLLGIGGKKILTNTNVTPPYLTSSILLRYAENYRKAHTSKQSRWNLICVARRIK